LLKTHLKCGGKRSATPLWMKVAPKRQQIQSAGVVGALQNLLLAANKAVLITQLDQYLNL
jgi:hypothetical protein